MNLAFVDNYDFPPRFQESQKNILEKSFVNRDLEKSQKVEKVVQDFGNSKAEFVLIRDQRTYRLEFGRYEIPNSKYGQSSGPWTSDLAGSNPVLLFLGLEYQLIFYFSQYDEN